MSRDREIRRLNVREGAISADDLDIVEFEASRESVETVLSAPIDENDWDHDGRSAFKWFHLPNGDWILGVWPHGDTYMSTELDREY